MRKRFVNARNRIQFSLLNEAVPLEKFSFKNEYKTRRVVTEKATTFAIQAIHQISKIWPQSANSCRLRELTYSSKQRVLVNDVCSRPPQFSICSSRRVCQNSFFCLRYQTYMLQVKFRKRLLGDLTGSTLRSKQCFPTSRTAITRLSNIRFILFSSLAKCQALAIHRLLSDVHWSLQVLVKARYVNSGAMTKYFMLFKYVRSGGQLQKIDFV
jgi:hypothetical protein